MCGRYGRRGDKQYIAEHYSIRRAQYDNMPEEHPYAFAPNYKQKASRPWAVSLTDDRLFSFGGVWDHWKDELVRTYPAEGMKAWRVKPLRGNGSELLEPITSSDESPPNLF